MVRTYRRGESFLLARHGRRRAVRPQVRSGCAVFSVGFVLAIWATTTIRRAGNRVETNTPTTAIVENGPYRFTRSPIYICMFLGQAGLAMGFNSAWIFARWRRSRYKTFSAVISGILTRMASNHCHAVCGPARGSSPSAVAI